MPRARPAGAEGPPILEEWICGGPIRTRVSPAARRLALSACRLAASLLHGRVEREGWIRYQIRLDDALPEPPEVRLEPLTDAIVDRLRRHPDHDANQLKSGFRFWDHGLRHAYIWMAEEEPLCVQWLLTAADDRQLRSLPRWSGMYPPLPAGCGQVENLYTFSTTRRKGVATQFEHALFLLARRSGLTHLLTHIHADNAAARGWADRTGWRAFGRITHIHLDVPLLRAGGIFVHDAEGPSAAPLGDPARPPAVGIPAATTVRPLPLR